MAKPKVLLPFIILGVLMVVWGLAVDVPVSAAPLGVDRVTAPPSQQTEQYCLSCHGDPDLKMTLPSGEELSLYVSLEHLKSSVHSPAGIECEACHTEIKTYPHPAIDFQTRRELSRSYYQACQKCHSANYEKAQDSMHAQVAAAGNLDAAICTDCHGAHDVQAPDQPRAKISQTCSQGRAMPRVERTLPNPDMTSKAQIIIKARVNLCLCMFFPFSCEDFERYSFQPAHRRIIKSILDYSRVHVNFGANLPCTQV